MSFDPLSDSAFQIHHPFGAIISSGSVALDAPLTSTELHCEKQHFPKSHKSNVKISSTITKVTSQSDFSSFLCQMCSVLSFFFFLFCFYWFKCFVGFVEKNSNSRADSTQTSVCTNAKDALDGESGRFCTPCVFKSNGEISKKSVANVSRNREPWLLQTIVNEQSFRNN